MRPKIGKADAGWIEPAGIAQRLRADFPQSTAPMNDAELLKFSRACADQALALGNLKGFEQVYLLAAVNANLARIKASPVGKAFFDKILGSPDLDGRTKIDLLHLNLSRYFEGASGDNA